MIKNICARTRLKLILVFWLPTLAAQGQYTMAELSGQEQLVFNSSVYRYYVYFVDANTGVGVPRPPADNYRWRVYNSQTLIYDSYNLPNAAITSSYNDIYIVWPYPDQFGIFFTLDDGVESSWSDWLPVSVVPPTPPAPTVLAPSNITATSFRANWSNVPEAAQGYYLTVKRQRFVPSPGWDIVTGYQNLYIPPGVTGYNVTGLGYNNYTYSVYAVNQYAVRSADSQNAPTFPTVPPAPDLFVSSIRATSFSFSLGLGGFISESYHTRLAADPGFSQIINTYTSNFSVEVSNLTPNANYYLQAKAMNSSGSSGFGSTRAVLTLPLPPLAKAATNISFDSFVANWVPVNGVSQYAVDVSTNQDFSEMIYEKLPATGSSIVIGNLTRKIKYYYRIMSKNNTGYSDPSATIEAPSFDFNFVKTITPQKASSTETISEAVGDAVVMTDFIDGLGRIVQQVSKQTSPSLKDLNQPLLYDAHGRVSIQMLPMVSGNNGWYKQDILNPETNTYIGEAASFYTSNPTVASDPVPFSKTIFEPSPLNRVIKQGAPGQAWQPSESLSDFSDRSVKYAYAFNTQDEVLLFRYDETSASVSAKDGAQWRYFAPNMLYRTSSFDEENREVIEYKDETGKVIAKMVEYRSEGAVRQYASTYYIYDDLDNLVVVLPPEAVEEILNH